MLREEKIRRMTDLAMFEKKNGKKVREVSDFYRTDYVFRSLVRGFVSYTVSFVMIGILFVFYNLDMVLDDLDMKTLTVRVTVAIALYILGMITYLLIVGGVYGRRYDRQVTLWKQYLDMLTSLSRRYEYHERAEELMREEKRG
ncbi:hypothetical protein ACTQ56_04970 [[Clostridium] aminophilum]|uniref:Uncharacterized protein n=1 Tax=[Clostridium] aminophilum TaxID=1526 RepID=A0A1I0DNI7_9FIRM|nr:hypothetical protein [[Clostridium] aminophilum]MDD6196531.1 hypothetical protein [[Clostridium] aminophilum]SET33913.1 hypothetical protein SAMN04487771_101339 [[Clostridium] aminophilum]